MGIVRPGAERPASVIGRRLAGRPPRVPRLVSYRDRVVASQGVCVFPYYDDIVTAVPEYDRYLGLTALEASTDRLTALHAGKRAGRDRVVVGGR